MEITKPDTSNKTRSFYANTQLKLTGPIIEFRTYEHSFFIGTRPETRKIKKKEKSIDKVEGSYERQYYRAKRDLRDSINCNAFNWSDEIEKIYLPIFITFTFAENIQDIPAANYEFTKFIQRFNHLITGEKKSYLKYAVVIEFQKRGAIHYHALFFNLPYLTEIKTKVAELWGNGFVQVKSVHRVKNVARYMSKYMSKRFDDPRLHGKKCYFVSHGLKQPVVIYNFSTSRDLLTQIPQEAIEYQKDDIPAGDYMGSMSLTRYNLTDFPKAQEQAIAFLRSSGYDGPEYDLPLKK
jgi:hypothetical protein